MTAPLPRAPSQPAAPGAPSPVSVQGHQPLVRDVLPGIVDASPVPVALFRTDRTVAYRNDAWLALFGEAGLDAEPDQVDPIARTLADGTGSVALERHVRRADGVHLPILLDVTPVVDDRSTVIGAVAFAEPLDRVAASTLRDAFIGVLSHELRTPITSIYGGSQLLLHDDLSADSRTEVLAAIASEAERLHRRVEDFLAVVRVERGGSPPEREPLSMARLVRQALTAETRRSGWRRFAVHVAPDLPPAAGDAAQIGQVLRNLVANAVTNSAPGSTVAVEVVRSDDAIETRVKDRSADAPDERRDTFSLAHRHVAAGGHTPTSGLALYVSRALIEANGGRIRVRPRRGGGSEVVFTLPTFAETD